MINEPKINIKLFLLLLVFKPAMMNGFWFWCFLFNPETKTINTLHTVLMAEVYRWVFTDIIRHDSGTGFVDELNEKVYKWGFRIEIYVWGKCLLTNEIYI